MTEGKTKYAELKDEQSVEESLKSKPGREEEKKLSRSRLRQLNIEDYKQEDVGLASARNLGLEDTMEVRELREIQQVLEQNAE